jgi:dCMP deaminase
MTCVDPATKELVPGTNSCSMCKRLIINAGVSRVIVRDTRDAYRVINVEDWVNNDESLEGTFGY